MDLDRLRLFVDVGARLSFAAVAEDRGINPSSVSRAVGLLEEELGLRLFHRSTRRMALTEGGVLFLRRVTEVLEAYDEAQDEARAISAGPTGTLKMTASVAFGERVLMPLVPSFRLAHPNVKLEMVLTDANLDLVGEGIDLAVRLAARLEGEGVATKLIDTRYRICASPAYLGAQLPIRAPADLANRSCLLLTLPAFRSTWRFRDRRGALTEVPVTGDVAISSALGLRAAVLAGAGPALLADWLIDDDIAAGRVVDLFPDHDVAATTFDTAAWLLYPSRAYVPQKVRAMIGFLRDAVHALPKGQGVGSMPDTFDG